MTLQTLAPILDTSIATKTATAFLHRAFIEIKKLQGATTYSDEWLEESLSLLRFSDNIKTGLMFSVATILAIYKDVWNDLPLTFRKQYFLNFYEFAKNQTGGKQRSTIDGYVATAKIWILNEYESGRRIEIKKRSAEGKPIRDEYGREITEIVEFCPYIVDFTKLSILNPRALQDNMTDKLWEMLADPFYTCDDVRAEHHKNDDRGEPQYTLKFGLLGPLLAVYQNGKEGVVIGEFDWEAYEHDPLVREAINYILKIFSIEMDEDKIFRMIREGWK